MQSKTFDTSTLKGLKSAERFKARMENQYENVTTVTKGLFGVVITGSNPPCNACIGGEGSTAKCGAKVTRTGFRYSCANGHHWPVYDAGEVASNATR